MASSEGRSPRVSRGASQEEQRSADPAYTATSHPPNSDGKQQIPVHRVQCQGPDTVRNQGWNTAPVLGLQPSPGVFGRGRGIYSLLTVDRQPAPIGDVSFIHKSQSDARASYGKDMKNENDTQIKGVEETTEKTNDAAVEKCLENSAGKKTLNKETQEIKQDTAEMDTLANVDVLKLGSESSKVLGQDQQQQQAGTSIESPQHGMQANSWINSGEPPPYSLYPNHLPLPGSEAYSMMPEMYIHPGCLPGPLMNPEMHQGITYYPVYSPVYAEQCQTPAPVTSTSASVQEGVRSSDSGLQSEHPGPAAAGENGRISKNMDDGQRQTKSTIGQLGLSEYTAPNGMERELDEKRQSECNSLEQIEPDIASGNSLIEDTANENTILVRGILGLPKYTLELFFENTKKCGGDNVQSIDIFEEDDEAVITFSDNGVADRVLNRGPTFKIGSQTLTVERPPKPDPRSIQVQGLPESVSKDLLELFFENTKRSSGGDIDEIQYEAGSGEAVITFKEVEVAQRVLSRDDLALEGSPLKICPVIPKHIQVEASDCTHDKSCALSDPRVVYVYGVPTNTESDTLELWLESKKYGGGEIEKLDLDNENGTAVVTFVTEEDAARMLEKGTLTFNGVQLTFLSKKDSEARSVPHTSASSNKKNSEHISAKDLPRVNTVQIQNVQNMSEGYLKLALEKQASSKLDCITLYPEKSMAIARFTKSEGALHILQKKSITLEDNDCPVIPLYTEVHDKSPGCLAIMVSGITKDIDKQRLEMYFSNRRKSGGFGKLSVFMKADEGKAVITYDSIDAVKSVIGMSKKQGHCLKTAKLVVVKMEPLPPPPLIAEPTEPNKLIMLEAPPVSKEQLEAFLNVQSEEGAETHENISGIVITGLLFGWKNNTLLIEFSTKPDYNGMLAICIKRPLEDRMVSLQRVSLPTMIQVRAAQQLDKEDLELYFESKRSGGWEIEGDITMYEEEHCVVIDYGDNDAVKSVLQKQHKVGGNDVTVDAFYPAFGICPYDYDPTQPWNILPEPFNYKIESQFVWKFLFSIQSAWDLLCDIGERYSFEISREKSANNELYVCYKDDHDGTVPDAKMWEEQCRDELNEFFRTVSTINISTMNECYQLVLKTAMANISGEDGILLEGDNNQSIIILTGWEPIVRSISEKLRVQIKELEENKIRQNESVKENLNLWPPIVTMIKAKQYNKELTKKFPKLKVNIVPDGLCFTGLPDEIKLAKLQVFENIVQQEKNTIYACSAAKCKLLQSIQTRSFIISEFKKANIIVVFEVKDAQVVLHAMTQEELLTGQDIIEKAITEYEIPLQKESLSLLNSTAWNDLKTKFRNDFGDVFLLTDDVANERIQLVVTSNNCDIILEEIKNFFDENTVLQETIDVEHPVMELIRRFYADKLKVIEKKFARYLISIGVTGESFLVRGTKVGLPLAMKGLQDLFNKAVTRDHVISRPGMEKYFQSEKGRQAIELIERTNKVICVEPKHIRSVHRNQLSYDTEGSAHVLYTGKISRGPVVKVLVGDITKHRVDAIVNAANGKLEHIGGLAAAIVTAGGKTIQEECSKYMQSKASLLPGQVFTSASGNLPCKFVIHAVGPKWMGGLQGERNELFEATASSLDEAEKNMVRSVAIPAISSGIFGFPLDECTKTICEAVADYFEKNSTSGIAEVHLMDNRDAGGRSFVNSIQKHASDSGSDHQTAWSAVPATGTSYNNQTISDKTQNAYSGETMLSRGSTSDSIITREGITITIKRGSLPDQQADALMNSTQCDLHLGAGGVSAVLLKAAGPVIQQECTSNKPSSFGAGDIVVTSGGNLPVKSIFHGYCETWDGGQAATGLKTFVANALKEADSRQYQSMALPAIGTGNLKYPHDVVIKSMIGEIVSFSSANPNTTLKDIYVVLFPGDQTTMKAFEDYWKSPSLPQQGRTRRLINTHQEKQTTSKYKKNQSTPFVDSIIEETKKKITRQIGSMRITVKEGDITKEDTDVIMNITDPNFGKGAVFEALIKAGGKKIGEELQKIGRFECCVMSGAGRLRCKKILHVNGLENDWHKLLLEAFQLADTYSMRSLAMPAIGTGIRGHSAHEMSKVIFNAIMKFIMKQKPHSLEEIRIVIFDKTAFTTFRDQMKSPLKGQKEGFFCKSIRQNEWLAMGQ